MQVKEKFSSWTEIKNEVVVCFRLKVEMHPYDVRMLSALTS
jgi:hypothetical protein